MEHILKYWPYLAGTLAVITVTLTIIRYLSWLPRRNAKKIDCVEGDIASIKECYGRIDQKQTDLKELVTERHETLKESLDDFKGHINGKLDRLLKLNGE